MKGKHSRTNFKFRADDIALAYIKDTESSHIGTRDNIHKKDKVEVKGALFAIISSQNLPNSGPPLIYSIKSIFQEALDTSDHIGSAQITT